MPPSSSLAIAHPMLNDDLLYGPRGSYRRKAKAEEEDPHDDYDDGEEEEMALKDLLPSLLLRADDSADLVLVGVDADFEQRPRQIRAHRCILAARSVVFERMLYGPFAEASVACRGGNNNESHEERSVVRIGFEHEILRAVVEYCYTDRAAVFDAADVDLEGWARTMVRLCAAADYFRLPGLASTVRDILAERMTDDEGRPTALACAVLDEAECHGGGFVCCGDNVAPAVVTTGIGKVHEAAMRVIRCNALEALLHAPLDGGGGSVRGLEMCGPTAMETILSDGGVMVDELTMFRALHRWADADSAEEVNGGRRRWEIARGLSDRYIHLTRITSEDLRTVVAPTGLVPPDLLDTALRERTALEEGRRDGPHRPRPLPPHCRGPAWDVSGSAVLECTEPRVTTSLLNCEGLSMMMTPGSGVHRWSVEVIKLSVGDNDEIGVALWGGVGDPTSWLSRRENMAWVCESRGNAYHGGKCRSLGGAGGGGSPPLEFGPGSVVSFELDLTTPGCGGGGVGGGRLSVSVDGGSTWVLMFDDMLGDEGRRQQRQRKPSQDDGGEDGDGDGEMTAPISFVPAVSLYHRAAVRFLGFETLGRSA